MSRLLKLPAATPFYRNILGRHTLSPPFSRHLHSTTTNNISFLAHSSFKVNSEWNTLRLTQSKCIHTEEKKSLKDKFASLGFFGTNAAVLVPLFFIAGLSFFTYEMFKDDADTKENKKVEKSLEKRRKKILEALSDVIPISNDEANAILTKSENSNVFEVFTGGKISKIRIDSNQVASNKEIEDRFHVDSELKNDLLILAVFDGHSGYNCSEYVSKNLPSAVRKEVEPLFQSLAREGSFPRITELLTKITEKVQDTFCRLDDFIVHEIRKTKKDLAREDLLPAVNGSCALLAAVDIVNKNLFVACTGDSRAVLGSLQENGRWIAIPLSKDQTARNPKELSRILKEHPGEEDTAIQRNRILGGLEPTRAFGDARYKWNIDVQQDIYPKFFPERKPPPKNLKTPPYVTAKPEVHFHKLDARHDQFLVLATDGLYDELSSQRIVELVGDQLARPAASNADNATKLRSKKSSQEAFAFQDSNLATHLIRNAIGGGKFEMRDGEVSSTLMLKRLSIPAPKSRSYRDDITVVVLLFGSASNN
ncbi:hypothetical protein DSO57_1023639 [Entomophthora muscae]|uniref:Uncharacterized protein n=1 Tax=Entomophthora muscae TaxID=34485 RepID=A0ACC2RHI9_9FUNG|nr:hypothetical protein DSO57_1023639 [Entomophthora muscae]